MVLEPTRVVLAVAILLALGFVWRVGDRGRWRTVADDRLYYGVPWGTLLTLAIVVAFYLFVQGGLREPTEPVTLPYVTWSYFYPTGLLTAGLAHGSLAHLGSNAIGTLAFAPIAEYAWGHYSSDWAEDEADDGPLDTPWVRALVIFPGALLAAAVLTAAFGMGPGLGFSGAVFAIAGVALVNFPVATVLATVAASALQFLAQALAQPVVRETFAAGPPEPPAWAGIGFQAHLLGFLLGAVVGIALCRRRPWQPGLERVFFATVLVGTVQSLWLLVWTADDVFYLYQGAGAVLVLGLAVATAVAVAGSDRPLPRLLASVPRVRAPSRRTLAIGWLLVLAAILLVGIAGTVLEGTAVAWTVGLLVVLVALLAVPAVPPLVPDRWLSSPVSYRQAAVVGLAVAAVLVALPSVPLGLVVVADDAVPGSGGLEVGGYTVTYEENVTGGQEFVVDPVDPDAQDETLETRQSGLIVVDPDRELWSLGARAETIAYHGNESVELGGLGWRETVTADRTGWDVVGNETAYVVDLEADGERTRSFASEPVRADVRLDGLAIEVVPTDERFELRVTEDGSELGVELVPAANESATVGEVQFSTTDDGDRLVASVDDTDVLVAERETDGDRS